MTIEALIASFGLANLLALGGVVLIGLPHGAFDGAIAACLGQANRPVVMIRFIILYVALAGFVVGLWLVFPVASLIGFLGISIVHFGLGDARAGTGWFRYVQAVAHGGVVVAGISQSHRLEVDVIFGYLIGGDAAPVWMAIDVASGWIATGPVSDMTWRPTPSTRRPSKSTLKSPRRLKTSSPPGVRTCIQPDPLIAISRSRPVKEMFPLLRSTTLPLALGKALASTLKSPRYFT